MGHAVIIRNLSKRYGKVPVFRGLELVVEGGEFLCIVGPNGAGKSTLLKVIAGLTNYEGHVEVNAMSVGYLGGGSSLYPGLTLGENLEVFRKMLGVTRERLETLLRDFDLMKFLNLPAENLSHGTLRKAEFIIAVMDDPELLLLDEPLISLDYYSRTIVLGLLKRMKLEGKTVIAVTHFPEILGPLCDRVLVLERGILRETSREEIT